jgi:hypothetical protein
MNNLAKSVSAEQLLENLAHTKYHIDTLFSMFPDLETYQDADNLITYFSKSVHSTADGIEFFNYSVGYCITIHVANPFKNININCEYCSGDIKIYTSPSRIPLFLYSGSEVYPNKDSIFNVMAYEDIYKINNISQEIIGKSHSYILQWIDKMSKNTNHFKLDLTFINKSIKNLLPFL